MWRYWCSYLLPPLIHTSTALQLSDDTRIPSLALINDDDTVEFAMSAVELAEGDRAKSPQAASSSRTAAGNEDPFKSTSEIRNFTAAGLCFTDPMSDAVDQHWSKIEADFKRGRERASNMKVLFTGTIRNAEVAVVKSYKMMKWIGQHFQDYHFLVLEDGSIDKTSQFTKKLTELDERYEVKETSRESGAELSTMKHAASVRNKLHDWIAQFLQDKPQFDLIAMYDFGLNVFGWDAFAPHTFFATLGRTESVENKWDMICANSLRHHKSSPANNLGFHDCFNFRASQSAGKSMQDYCYSTLSKNVFLRYELMPVQSCFGGLAFYKPQKFLRCKYDPDSSESEHVSLHKCMKDNGSQGRMFMDPMLTTIYDYGIAQTCASAPMEKSLVPLEDPMEAEMAPDKMEAEMAPDSAAEAPAAPSAEAAAPSSTAAAPGAAATEAGAAAPGAAEAPAAEEVAAPGSTAAAPSDAKAPAAEASAEETDAHGLSPVQEVPAAEAADAAADSPLDAKGLRRETSEEASPRDVTQAPRAAGPSPLAEKAVEASSCPSVCRNPNIPPANLCVFTDCKGCDACRVPAPETEAPLPEAEVADPEPEAPAPLPEVKADGAKPQAPAPLPEAKAADPDRQTVVPSAPAAPASPAPAKAKAAPRSGSVKATGDPHLVNMYGQKFDIFHTGVHTLIRVPKLEGSRTLLKVSADVQQFGGACADLYFRAMNLTGRWVPRKKGLFFTAQRKSKQYEAKWLNLGKLKLKVVWGHTNRGVKYLNFFVKHLTEVSNKFAVGGLLGEDDHTAVATPKRKCKRTVTL